MKEVSEDVYRVAYLFAAIVCLIFGIWGGKGEKKD